MIRLALYTIIGALVSALATYLLAGGLPEGAVAGALLGGSLGLLVAMRHGAGDSSASFEFEAAGIHDDNLITTARRNLVREAYRQSYERSPRAEMERRWSRLGSARGRLLADTDPQTELAERIERRHISEFHGWLAPQDRAQAHDLEAPPAAYQKRKRKPKRKRQG